MRRVRLLVLGFVVAALAPGNLAQGAIYQLVVKGNCSQGKVVLTEGGTVSATVVYNDISCCANSGCGGFDNDIGPGPCDHTVKLWGGGEEVHVDVSEWDGNVGQTYEIEVTEPFTLFGQYTDGYCSDNTPTGTWKDTVKSETILEVKDSLLVVNDPGDAADADLGDGQCETGTGGGTPVCTLRAAMEEANVQPGPNTIFFNLPHDYENAEAIQPLSALPILEESTTLDGKSQPYANEIVIDGANAGDADGLQSLDGEVAIHSVTVRNFGGHAVYALGQDGVVANDVVITGNCGWGIQSAGPVHINDVEQPYEPSRIVENGIGEGCDGGGVVSLEGGVTARYVQVLDNGATGILAKMEMDLTQVKVSYNLGDGVATPAGVIQIDGQHEKGVVGEFSFNRGAGIRAFGMCDTWGCTEGIDVQGAVTVEENGSWGIYGKDQVSVGRVGLEATKQLTKLSNNGKGADCQRSELTGDGVATKSLDCSGGALVSGKGAVWLVHAEVKHNGGAGVLAAGHVDLQGVRIMDNQGQGVYAGGYVWVHLAGGSLPKTEVSNNHGHGIETLSGCPDGMDCDDVMLEGASSVSGNGAWGIISHGAITVGKVQLEGGYEWSHINNNGHGTNCQEWILNEGDPQVTELLCESGGVLSLKGTVDLYVTEVKANRGPGVLADDTIHVQGAIVDDNGGEGLRSDWGEVDIRPSIQPTTVRYNGATGIFARSSANAIGDPIYSVQAQGWLEISGNSGGGIYTTGAVSLGEAEPGLALAERSKVAGNGGGQSCNHWHIIGATAEGIPAPCETFGILSEGYAGPLPVVIRNTEISDNNGDGLRVEGEGSWLRAELSDVDIVWNGGVGLWANGDVDYSNGQVCNNTTGNVQVSGERQFSNVEVCPEPDPPVEQDVGGQQPDGGTSDQPDTSSPNQPDGGDEGEIASEQSDGGCSKQGGPAAPALGGCWLLLAMLLLLIQARRRNGAGAGTAES